jgi:hypothetical protein
MRTGIIKIKPYRVGIFITKPFAYKNIEGEYTGMYINIWNRIKESLITKVRAVYGKSTPESSIYVLTFIDDLSYEQGIDSIENGTYNLILTDFNVTPSRCEKVYFTTPVMIGKDVIVYHKDNRVYSNLKGLLKAILPITLTLVALSLVSGILFYVIHRSYGTGIKTAIFTMLFTLMGSFTPIFNETKTKNPFLLSLLWIIVIFSFFYSLIYRTKIIVKLLPKFVAQTDAHKFDIKNNNIMIPKGTCYPQLIQNLGANYVEYDTKDRSVKSIMSMYMASKSRDKLSGVMMPWVEAKRWVKVNKEFGVSPLNYIQSNYISFAVGKQYTDLLADINEKIHILHSTHSTNSLNTLCRDYTGDDCCYNKISTL